MWGAIIDKVYADLPCLGKCERERASLADAGAVHPDLTATRFNEILCYREPDPASASDSRSGFIDPIEAGENVWEVFRIDADASVFNRKFNI
jgi:hypothetical protein